MIDTGRIHFRRLTNHDLPIMLEWLNSGFASQWYGKKVFTMSEIEEKYLPIINLEKPTLGFLIIIDDSPIGYIQTYLIKDYPDYANAIQIDEHAAGLDVFIGELSYIHKGLGKDIIRAFLQDIVFTVYDVKSCILGPEPDNTAAIKTYEKVGFRYVKSVETDDGIEYIMRVTRDGFV